MADPDKNTRRVVPAVVTLGLLSAFFVSGAASLIHEVVWIRLLRHVMGNSSAAISTVLTTFMAGLALGSYAGGRWIDRQRHPLRVFAILEGAIGLYCLVLPTLITASQPIYRMVYADGESSPALLGSVRFLVCASLLLVPASMMGATLPVLSRWLTATPERVGSAAGQLYAINTFGAVVGAASAGFLWIPELGVSRTILLASGLNLTVGLVAFLLHRRTAAVQPVADAMRPATHAAPDRSRTRILLLCGYGLAGAAALTFEVAWTRVLSLMIGGSVYAFSMILTGFIFGLALGSAILSRFVDRIHRPLLWLAGVEVAVGLSALLVVPILGHLPFFLTRVIFRFGDEFWRLQGIEFALVLAVLLVPTTLMGAAFPLASRLFLDREGAVGRSVGTIYAANTVGAIAGAFLGGFVLIPLMGLQQTIFVAAGLCVSIGVILLFAGSEPATPRRWVSASASVLIAATIMAAIPPWGAQLLSFGPFVEGRRARADQDLSAGALRHLAEKKPILFHKEGRSVTLTVKELGNGGRVLLVNGKADASSGRDMATQVLSAHLPILFHRDPKDALVIGLASGVTVGSVARYPLKRIDCVEIAPTMVEAAEYFSEFNHDVLRDERVRILLNDGRNHLALGSSGYDVIISEPTNPWVAGVADLFTLEYFELIRRRLNPGGVTCIWLAAYNLDETSFRSVVRTFQSVFPHVTIWNTVATDFLLVGSEQPLQIDSQELMQRAGRGPAAADLARIDVDSALALLARLVMDTEGARAFAGDVRLHTDDNAHLEFAAPRLFTSSSNMLPLQNAIYEYRHRPGLGFLSGPGSEDLKQLATRAIKAKQLAFQAEFDLFEGRQEAAIQALEAAGVLNPSEPGVRENVRKNLSMAQGYLQQQQPEEAIYHYRIALRILPADPSIHAQLASVLRDQGDSQEALTHYMEALQSYLTTGRPADARRIAKPALELARNDGRNALVDRLSRLIEQR